MTDQAADLAMEQIHAKIEELLTALVNGRDERTVQELQTLASLECKIGDEREAFVDWL